MSIHTNVYTYEKLPSSSSFRILELLPGAEDESICYKLHFSDWMFPDELPYEAISYAWGDPKITADTICDGKVLAVTSNLKDGLAQLRYQDCSRYLWADSICIDQTDKSELGHQVSNMRQIYQNSKKVLVWLGKDEANKAKRAIAAMDDIASACCKDQGISLSQLSLREELRSIVFGVPYYRLACNTDDSWRSLDWYFSRNWFSRLWVFQEVNSGREVDMICGDHITNWDIVALAATYLRCWPSVSKFREGYYENAYIMRNRTLHAQFSLPELLSCGRNFQTTDARDRIYGFLGLPSLRNMTPALKVDYNKSRLHLYQEVVERSLLRLHDYDILSQVQHIDRVQDDFPSWIPQWDQRSMQSPINAAYGWTWEASKQVSGSSRIDSHRSVLYISGLQLDTIETVTTLDSAKLFDLESHAPKGHPLTQFWRSQMSKAESYFTGEKMVDVYGMVLTTGLNSRYQKACDNRQKFDADFAAFIITVLLTMNEDVDQFPTLILEGKHGGWQNYQMVASKRCWNRSLFTTKEGYMGLGPNALQIGDLVCTLFGCNNPLILRPQNGHYRLVGAAYVHGVMEGEMIQWWEDGKLTKREFEIH